MSKIRKITSKLYVYIILIAFYIPLLIASIFAFNQKGSKGDVSFAKWFGTSTKGFEDLATTEIATSLLNTILIGLIVAILVVVVSLLTSYALWLQRNKIYKNFVSSTSNIYLINPDIISAISMFLAFSVLFGSLTYTDPGIYRTIIAQTSIIIPFGITLMLPRSNKFNKSQVEASKDLGYGPVKTWFKTYFIYMLPIIIATFLVALALSFDDFIFTRVTSNTTDTIGVKLYQGRIENWTLIIGTILLFFSLICGGIYSYIHGRSKNEKTKK